MKKHENPDALLSSGSGQAIQRIATRNAEIGDGLEIRRALPSRSRRTVGAWCFLDHAGPVDYAAGHGLSVGPHPHIGLQTFTWMIEGEVLHQDSLGNEQWIRPGQVNLMSAGSGIAHAENSAADRSGRLQAAQLWIALPEAQRHGAPEFRHYPELPALDSGGFRITVLVGDMLGRESPVAIHSPLLGLDLACGGAAETVLPLDPLFEHAVLVLEGEAEVAGEAIQPGTLLYLGTGRETLPLAARTTGADANTNTAPTRLLLIGGTPFEEEILLWWNFVARTPEEIAAATKDWNEGRRFPDVPGATGKRLVAPETSALSIKKR